MSYREQQELSLSTRGQAKNPELKRQRSLRLTVSNLKAVASRKKDNMSHICETARPGLTLQIKTHRLG